MQSEIRSAYQKYNGLLWGALAFIIIVSVLFCGDDIGLSNNGDFGRVMRAAGLSFGQTAPRFTYADEYIIAVTDESAIRTLAHILFSSDGWAQYPSIHVLFVRLAAAAEYLRSCISGGAPVFRMGSLGVMYAVLYAAGLGLLCHSIRLPRLWTDGALKAVILLIECDIGYISYFNSLFSEPVQHIALIWFIAAAIRAMSAERPAWKDAVGLSAAALFYGWAKFFNIPVAILATAAASLALFLRGKRWTSLIPGLISFVLLVGIWAAVPSWMDTETNYNALFYGILRDTDAEEAAQYLRDMHLPEELAVYRDTNYYTDGAVQSMQDAGSWDPVSGVSKADLIMFYLSHPSRLAHQAKLTAMHCGQIRPWYLANHGNNHPLMSYSNRMSAWTQLRGRLALDTLWGILVFTTVFFSLSLLYVDKNSHLYRPLLSAALFCALIYTFLLPVMLNGEGDLAKHMFAYAELTDLMVPAMAAMMLCPAGGVNRVLFRATIVITAACMLFPMTMSPVRAYITSHRTHIAPEPGAFVSFGSRDGSPLIWLVLEADDGEMVLWYAGNDISMPFDAGGGNDWSRSTLRDWLNTGFLEGFSEAEVSRMIEQENPLILAAGRRADAETGDLEFACSHIPVLAARGYDRAYKVMLHDLVTLPDIDMIAALSAGGCPISGEDLWLETPYCPTDTLARYRSSDGYILFGPTTVARAVRPVIRIENTGAAVGSGSLADPFAAG